MNPFTMRAIRLNLIATVLASLLLFSCDHTTEDFKTDQLSDYQPLQPGKYITYRLDSTVFTNFGAVTAIRSFQEKHVVDAQIPDALGRPAYRILRFTRDTAGTQPWAPAGTYFITPLNNTLELVENNLRFVKLVMPIKQDNTWKGNRYLPDDAYGPLFNFNNDFGMDAWDYTYSSVNGTALIKGQTYTGVLTVDGINEAFNATAGTATVINPSLIAYVNYLQNKYAKGIGLIYEEYMMWEYQPPNGTGSGATNGFGIRRSIIDHN